MQRRELVLGLGLAGAALGTAAVAATDEHAGHDHAQHASGSALVDSALRCVRTAEVCMAHCLQVMGGGDRSMEGCGHAVNALRSVCGTLAALAIQKSPLLGQYAAVAKQFCDACEKECRQHADEHVACKDCADACVDCSRECAKLAG